MSHEPKGERVSFTKSRHTRSKSSTKELKTSTSMNGRKSSIKGQTREGKKEYSLVDFNEMHFVITASPTKDSIADYVKVSSLRSLTLPLSAGIESTEGYTSDQLP